MVPVYKLVLFKGPFRNAIEFLDEARVPPYPSGKQTPPNQSIHSWPPPAIAFAQWVPDAEALENRVVVKADWAVKSGSVTYLEMTLAMPCSQSLVL